MRAVIAMSCLLAVPALAADFQISPVTLSLSAKNPSSYITLTNSSDEPLSFEVTAHNWAQASDGAMQISDTDDIVFYPGIVQLAPGESRTIRVGTTIKAEAVERTYRMFIEELPSEKAKAENGIRVMTRVGVPIFIAPTQAQTEARFTQAKLVGGKLFVTLENSGTVHYQAQAVHVTATRGQETTFNHDESAWYVLAHSKREFVIAMPADACQSDHVRVSLRAPDVEAHLELPGGCH